MNIGNSPDEKGMKYDKLARERGLRVLRSKRKKAERKREKHKETRAAASIKRNGFYNSEPWMAVRYQALKLYGGACQCCGRTRKDGIKIHVDHIKPRSKYPALQLELGNLQILCEPCNLGKRASDETDWR